MIRKKRNWRRLLVGGVVASGLLTLMLYGFVFTKKLALGLAIPWIFVREKVFIVDWTCLFLVSFATAILLGVKTSHINWAKGMLGGFSLGLILIIIGSILGENIYGAGYYILCYLVWGWSFGLIVHQKKHLIIRRFHTKDISK